MNQEKCPSCGAALTPHQPVCTYCGRDMDPIINTTWTDVKTELPPPSEAEGDRSDFVLTCHSWNPLNQEAVEKQKENYGNLVSAYYSYTQNKWINEQLMTKDPLAVSHWMQLPAEDASGWIAVEEALPDKASAFSAGYSVPVLTSTRGIDYEMSLNISHTILEHKAWFYAGYYQFKNKQYPNLGIARWHPLPVGPQLEMIRQTAAEGSGMIGKLKSFFGKK